MKKRLTFLITLFLILWTAFLLQKPLFMLYNSSNANGYPACEWLRVIYHAASLDAATTGYLLIVPWILVFLSIWTVNFPFRKILTAYYIPISLILSVIFVGDMCLYPFWKFKLDGSVFLYLASPQEAMASVSAGFIALRVFFIIILTIAYAYALYRTTPVYLHKTSKRIASSAVMLLTGGLIFLIIRGGVSESTSNIGQVYFCNDEFLNHSAVNPAFSLLSSLNHSQNYADRYNLLDEKERKRYFDSLYPTSGEQTQELLNTKRPNILIILMEGFGGTMVGALGGMPNVSPNIDRLSQEGIWFTQCYANSFRTDRGTICALSGYQSFPDVSVMKFPAKSRTLPSIASSLRKEGYTNDFLYGGDINFTNMKSYLLSTGYGKLTSDIDFPPTQRQNAWGVNDDITFDYLYHTLLKRKTSPWHTAFLTLSSHEPFKVPYHRLNDKKANAFAYTDHCLGEFIERIRQTPQWKNLLIICLPDHGINYPEQPYGQGEKVHHIPMLWLGGAVKEHRVIDCIMNQSDMAATLLAQLGIEHSEFTFSRNVLGSEYRYPFAYWSFGGGFAFADSTGTTILDVNSIRPIIETPTPNNNRTLRAKSILQTSYDDLGNR